jgi:lipopolysaccharide export LptBFGC system permease protein LptF
MKKILLLILVITFGSCIPLSVAPNIEDYKIMKGKKFKRKLPKKNTFVFNDPKKAGEFYQFLDAKYDLEKQFLDGVVSIDIENKNYILSFYEVEKKSKTLNLVPILVDAKRESKNKDPLLEDIYTSRSGEIWYIAITMIDENNTDCLNSKYDNNNKVETYLVNLKNEYLSTNNYLETLLKRN